MFELKFNRRVMVFGSKYSSYTRGGEVVHNDILLSLATHSLHHTVFYLDLSKAPQYSGVHP